MQPSLQWLTDPRVFAVNRLPAHSDHTWQAGEAPTRQSLDGAWAFTYSPDPASRPAEFYRPDADLSAFGSIQVPGHIEMQGYGQIQYINTMYPWDGRSALRPPQIDWDNAPVGSYVREFALPQAWAGQRVCVSFQGVEQAFYCWCNGQFVGYGEDSFTPTDFDLTPYLKAGQNRLCVEVHKRSSAAWLEDQDFFRFFGIFRSVYLYAKPDLHCEDLWLQATLDADDQTGVLAPRLKLSTARDAALGRVQCRVAAPGGAVLYDAPLVLRPAGEYLQAQAIRLPGVRPWCHADPALYTVELALYDDAGALVETVPYRTGFRRFELVDGVLRLNGERVVFNGVNRHEWEPGKGRAIGAQEMFRAMETFRRNNINAVRTCHYPDQSLWYDLCDENGIYMIDETNLESHGSWQKMGAVEPSWNVPGSLPEWRDCVLDRARSMLERDKNHTAVLLWSCGNESYAGENILAMTEFFHAADPSRPVHYEGVFHCREFDAASDVESRMYATPQAVREYLESKPAKPFMLCEYMHDMGNSLGGMEHYIALADQYEQYQGGFIWDYMDQALWHTDALGRRVLGYGGDFGERPTDYNFSANGIVFADGTEKPAMQEVRYWYQSAADRAAWDAENARAAAAADTERAARQAVRTAGGQQAKGLKVIHGDVGLGVQGDGFEVLFSYTEGGPASLVVDGQQWLYRAPRPAFWRAATENDKGNAFAQRSAAWLAADALPLCTGYEVEEASAERVCVTYRFASPAVPGMQAKLCYTVQKDATLTLEAHYSGAQDLPELPCFGVRLTTPAPVQRVQWVGLSGETYPDRYKGGAFGCHTETPQIADYLVPQECGCHVQTREVRLQCQNTGGRTTATLCVEALDTPFAFSALPYTAQQLETADHREDLPAAAHTHLCLYAAMRGVGGIDSWGSDVEESCRVSAQKEHTLRVVLPLR